MAASELRTKLDERRIGRAKAQIDVEGVDRAAKRVGVARGTLLGAVAGANLQRGTLILLEVMIDALDQPPAPPRDAAKDRAAIRRWAMTDTHLPAQARADVLAALDAPAPGSVRVRGIARDEWAPAATPKGKAAK